VTTHASSCAASACWTGAFNQFDAGTACDTGGTCTAGCVRLGTCQDCASGSDYCHICPDRECTDCDTYGTCKASSCGTKATNDAAICKCNDGFDRSATNSENFPCLACHTNCKTCPTSQAANYIACTECSAGKVNLSGTTTWKYCLDVCPTKYTATSGDCAIATPDVMILSFDFNIPKKTYVNAGTTGATHNLTATISGTSAYPAKNRGIHFDGTADGFVEVPNYMLGHTFGIHSWMMFKATPAAGKVAALLTIDRNDFSSATSNQ
jgi:hypothetical protein